MARSVEAHVTPDLLRWARETAGLPTSRVVRRFKKLERWEAGEEYPTVSQLESLSDLYKRPTAVFYLPSPPQDPALPTDFRKLPDGQREPLSRASRLAIRTARHLQKTYADLLSQLGSQRARSLPRAGLNEDPERVAARLRHTLNIPFEDQLGWSDLYIALRMWRSAIEDLGVLVLQLTMPVNELRGFSFSEGPIPAIVASSSDATAARTFTFVHELTHLMLNRGGLCIPDPSSSSDSRDIEPFCNHVAGAVLLPFDFLSREPDLAAIAALVPDDQLEPRVERAASRLKVSRYVALRRIFMANRIERPQFNRLMAKWHAQDAARARRRSGGVSPAVKTLSQLGHRFVGAVLDAHGRGLVSTSDVSNILSLKTKHLSAVQKLMVTEARG